MSKLIAIVAFGLMSTASISWLAFINVEPRTTATVTTATAAAAAAEGRMIPPFELMIKHGKLVPVEQWPAF
jgi:hypothetical protein